MTPPDTPPTRSAPRAGRQPNVPGGVTARLKERRRRVASVRKRALAAAASTFALVWGVIFFQLVSGHDPALAHNASRTATATTSSSGSTSSNAGSTSSGSASSGSGSTGAITTSQS
jgi:cytoskeletal protein RodZ